MQKHATNCFLINSSGQVLLSMKKRGFGVGKWNGTGGKIQEGETPEQTAVREIKEEIGVEVEIKDLEKIGEVLYKNPDPSWGMFVHIYKTKKWLGEPSESDEMKPQWFDPKDVPGLVTWPDTPLYFTHVMNGEKFKGEFVYKSDGEEIDHFNLVQVSGF